MQRRLLVLGLLLSLWPAVVSRADDRPNILWITCEDISPNLGCYGDSYAVTPNLDRLAQQSVRYTEAFAVIGVCAPARSTIISGMYACSIGTSNMRCQGTIPAKMKEYPRYLQRSWLLLHEPYENRLQLRLQQGNLGPERREGPLAEPQAGSTVFQRDQLHKLS